MVQHDRPLRRHAPMAALIEAMDERAELTHVALPTGRTHPQTYEHFAVSKYALKLGDRAVTLTPTLTLTRTLKPNP